MPARSVLVTGGTGLVGAHACARFAAAGWRVVAVDRSPRATDFLPATSNRIAVIGADIGDARALEAAVEEFSVTGIVHAAAIVTEDACRADPARAVAVNVTGTLAMLEIARRFGLPTVFVSTCAMYGHRPDLAPLDEDAAIAPYGIYDTTKRMAELAVQSYHAVFGLDTIIVRTGFVYGPGQESLEFPYLARAVRGLPVSEPAGADHPSDWTYVKDLAEGLFRALTVRPLQHRLFNVTGGRLYTRRDLAQAIGKAVPGAAITLGPGLLPEKHLRGPCTLTRARAELGYEPRYGLERGVAEFAQWLREGSPSRASSRQSAGAGGGPERIAR